jgi:small subunit ribosomal protein S3
MGQKTNPIGKTWYHQRMGLKLVWNDYGDKPAEDHKIRKYPCSFIKTSVSKVIIERTLKLVTVTITTARPGIIIGKGGQEVDKEELKKITEKRFN